MREQARIKKSQAAALRAQMAALDAGVAKLNNTIAQTNTFMRNLAERVQQTDLYYAKQMGTISEATLAYINKIKALYHSFSETSLDISEGSLAGLPSSNNPHDNPLTGKVPNSSYYDQWMQMNEQIKKNAAEKTATINPHVNDTRYTALLARCASFNIEQHKKDFVINVFPLLYQYERDTDIPLEVMFGQICTESSYGKDPLVEKGNNYFGYKGEGPIGSVIIETKEYVNGQWITIPDSFKAYNSIEESISDYVNLLQNNYSQYAKDNSPKSWASALEQGGYATAPDYGLSILDVAKTWRVYE